MLVIIPTPLGNLQDITQRAKEALSSCDALLCEDTRTTRSLLTQYNIDPPQLISYHSFNEKEAAATALRLLEEGKKIGLVSDAGTPCISDPGTVIVRHALENGFSVSALPGPSACITALSMSGLPFSQFQFVGFLPKEKKKLTDLLTSNIHPYRGVTVAYESPKRISQSLHLIKELFPEWELVCIKEISKIHETLLRGSAHALAEQLDESCTKGEWVVLFSELPHKEHSLDEALADVQTLMKECDLSLKTAVHSVALLRNISKNALYQATISSQ